jgi:hypothetical protein
MPSTILASDIRLIKPSDQDRHEARASLANLKYGLPYDIRPEDDPDILYVAGNLAVGNQVNRNRDAVDTLNTIKCFKKFEKKQCNIEHNRQNVVGYIIRAGLSEVGTNRIINEEEAIKSGNPFNIYTIAALWRVVNPELCDFIETHCDNPNSKDKEALSLSFEVGYDYYKILVMPRGETDVSKAYKIISPEDSVFSTYDSSLIKNGGRGVLKDGELAQLLCGDILPLGQGIVSDPAAYVKGISPITKTPEPAPIEVANSSNNLNTNSTNIMKLKLPTALSEKIAAELPKHQQTEAATFIPTSLVLKSGAEIKDAKLFGMDYVEFTYSADVDGEEICDVTIMLPLINVQTEVRDAGIPGLVPDVKEIAKRFLAELSAAYELLNKK